MRKLEQKEYPYTFSAQNPPVMRVKPGETIVTSIPDCWNGAVKNEKSRLLGSLSRSWKVEKVTVLEG